MKAFKIEFLIAAVCTTLLAAPAFAAVSEVIKADIPFSFYAGDEMFPAGNYTLTLDDPTAPTLLTIQAEKGERHEILLTEAEAGNRADTTINKSELVFDRYGKDNFLSAVKVSGFDTAREVPMSRLERQREEKDRERVTVPLKKAG